MSHSWTFTRYIDSAMLSHIYYIVSHRSILEIRSRLHSNFIRPPNAYENNAKRNDNARIPFVFPRYSRNMCGGLKYYSYNHTDTLPPLALLRMRIYRRVYFFREFAEFRGMIYRNLVAAKTGLRTVASTSRANRSFLIGRRGQRG